MGNVEKSIVSKIAVFLLVIAGTSGNAYADHAWGTFHWARTVNPLALQVVDSVTEDWDTVLLVSLEQWSLSDVLALEVTSMDAANNVRKRCQMVQGQMRVCNAAYGYNGWLGLATIGIDVNGHIDQGTAKVNDSYSTYWTNAAEKNHVMCQEIGHIFGLGHTSEDGTSQKTCMDYSSDVDSQWPNAHDYEQLAEIYAHVDNYNSYDVAGSDSGGGNAGNGCNAPPGKGCNKNTATVPPMGVRVVSGPNHEIWVAARADGGLWVHHIRLVPEN